MSPHFKRLRGEGGKGGGLQPFLLPPSYATVISDLVPMGKKGPHHAAVPRVTHPSIYIVSASLKKMCQNKDGGKKTVVAIPPQGRRV